MPSNRAFFSEMGRKNLRNGWETPKTLYKWLGHVYRTAHRYESEGDTFRFNQYIELFATFGNDPMHFHEFLFSHDRPAPHTVYQWIGVDSNGKRSKYTRRRGYYKSRLETCYKGIKRGLFEMECRAEDTINSQVCAVCGDDLQDRTKDLCDSCANHGNCPVCDGYRTVVVGVSYSSDYYDPPEDIEELCDACKGTGSYAEYSKRNI